MKKILLSLLIFSNSLNAQELFPLSEPASTMPKGVIGIRCFSDTYKEVKQWRNMSALRLMYGAGSKTTVFLTGIASNHHGDKMPNEFPYHNAPERGKFYSYQFEGFHLYVKHRFLTYDAQNAHFRMAAYGEGTYVNTTHHETEPDIAMGDNAGVGFGLIATGLKNKFATSIILGGVIPFNYEGVTPDPIEGLPDIPMRMKYGKTAVFGLSMGYLIFPKVYENYNQGNLNVYLEIKGKAYTASKVDLFINTEREYYVENYNYPPALQGGYFADISPGVQYIINSNLRIDCAVTFRLLGFSYARMYPVYNFGIQRYFYRK